MVNLQEVLAFIINSINFLIGNGRSTRRESGRVASKSKGKFSNYFSLSHLIAFIGSNVAKS